VMSVRALTFIARRRPSLISFQAVVRPMPAQAVKSAIDIAPPRWGLSPVIAMAFSQVARALCGFADRESWTTHLIGASVEVKILHFVPGSYGSIGRIRFSNGECYQQK
jgi:hypothetical protein